MAQNLKGKPCPGFKIPQNDKLFRQNHHVTSFLRGNKYHSTVYFVLFSENRVKRIGDRQMSRTNHNPSSKTKGFSDVPKQL